MPPWVVDFLGQFSAGQVTAGLGAVLVATMKALEAWFRWRNGQRLANAAAEAERMDEPDTAKRALPHHLDTVLEQHYRETVERLRRDLDASQAEARALRVAARDRADELEQVKGERENYLYKWVDARDHALHLRKELARALGVPENSPSIPPAPRTLGSQSALQPITVPPEGDDRPTPPRGIRVPRETP